VRQYQEANIELHLRIVVVSVESRGCVPACARACLDRWSVSPAGHRSRVAGLHAPARPPTLAERAPPTAARTHRRTHLPRRREQRSMAADPSRASPDRGKQSSPGPVVDEPLRQGAESGGSLTAGRRCARIEGVSLIKRIRDWLGHGQNHEEMSEAALRGSPAGGIGHHHPATDTLPPDDRGAEGGPPSHEDPLGPSVR
jgi:hypothetical protein